MDRTLLRWAYAIKARQKKRKCHPVLWLFTDAIRLPDPRPVVARLPKGLCGVVLRPEGTPDPRRLAVDLSRICRARRIALVVAGDWRLAYRIGAGCHLRRGRPMKSAYHRGWLTSSAHTIPELLRARHSGCDLVFLSAFADTPSHPGRRALGSHRWHALAHKACGIRVAALGGVTGVTVSKLGRIACGAGAISALRAVAG